MLGAMMVVGCFNRITFPAFIIVPALNLLFHFQRK
jgi:phosphatidylinositol glycan class Z